jgi:HPt (histidine-containing phosphotransfer) domain-containing protein/CheY-like chemotaxis protein
MCADGEPAPDVERWLSDPDWQGHGSSPLLMKDHHHQLTQVLQRLAAHPKGVSCVPVASVESFVPAFLQALGLLRWRNVTLLGQSQQKGGSEPSLALTLACQQLGMGLEWHQKVVRSPAEPSTVPSPAVLWLRLDTETTKLSVHQCIAMVLSLLPHSQRYTLWGVVLEGDAVVSPTWLKRFKAKLATLLSMPQPPVVVTHSLASPNVGASLHQLWQGLQQQQALAHTQSYFRQHPLVLLEDNPVSRLILTHQLADESLGLLAFDSAAAFDHWLRTVAQPEGQWPGLILADHHLGDGDVLSKTTHWCKAGLPTTTPVVLLSAYCDAIAPLPDLQATCLLPLVALLEKPLATETLLPYLQAVANPSAPLTTALPMVAPATQTATSPGALLAWNSDNLLLMLNHNTTLLEQLASVFCEDALTVFAKVEQAFNQQAWPTLYHEAHQLKGSASYFQAEALAETTAGLEAWAKQATAASGVSLAQLAQGSQWLQQCHSTLHQALVAVEQGLRCHSADSSHLK